MASDSILRLKVDSREYDSKLKSATDGLTRYIEGCRKVGGTMEVVETETLNYVRALGQMQTKSQSTRGAMSEMSKTFTELSMAYRQLSSEEKSSPFGTALRESLDQLAERTRNTKLQLQEINDQLNTEPKNSFSSIVSTMGSMSMAIQGVYGGLSTLSGAVTEMTEAFSIQEQAELRLQTIMRQRMGASDQDIEKIKQLTAEQQKLGVIGDEVQLAGAQQVATFLSERQSLQLLIPAMNDLAAQQKGLNVTSDDMVNIGNMFGKVMQGQVGALRRVGITFDESQEKVLKYGTEQERAAMLAEVITQNVGHMNRVLAATDSGKAKQAANNFGDMQEEIGRVLAKWEPFIKSFSQVGMITMGIGQIFTAITGVTRAVITLTASQSIANLNNRMATSIVNSLTGAFAANAVAATASATAIKAVTWSIRALEVATGIGIIIAGISVAVELLGKKMGATATAEQQMAASQQGLAKSADTVSQAYNSTLTSTLSSLKNKFADLKRQWSALKTEQEKTHWLEKNRKAFNDLGLSVNSVSDAERIFKDATGSVVESFRKRAQAAAYAAKLTALYQKQIDLLDKKRANTKAIASDAQRGGRHAVEGQEINDPTFRSSRYGYVNQAGKWVFSKQGAALYSGKSSKGNPINDNIDRQLADVNAKINEAERGLAESKALSTTPPAPSPKNNTKTGHSTATTSTPEKTEAPAIPGSLDALNAQLSALKKAQSANATDNEAWQAKQKEIDAVQAKIDKLTGKQKETPSETSVNTSQIDANTQKYMQLMAQREQLASKANKTEADTSAIAAIDAQAAALIKQNNQLRQRNDLLAQWKQQAQGQRDFTQFSQTNVSAFISDTQTRLANADFGSAIYNSLTSQLRDATAFSTLIQDAVKAGLDPSQYAGLWQQILAGKAVDDALNAMVDKINTKRQEMGQSPIMIDQQTGQVSDVTTTSPLSTIQSGWQDLEGIGGGIQSITQALSDNANAWQTLTGIINGFFQTINGITQVIELVNKLTSSTKAQTVAIGLQSAAKKADTATTTSHTVATIADTAASKSKTVANSGEAVSEAAKQGAKVPFPGNIAAIAAGVAAVVAALALIKSFSNGGIVHAATGSTVPGNHFSGDLVPAMVNSGELILNRAQQGNLAAQLDSQQRDIAAAQPYIDGETIYLGLSNFARRSGLGELVFSR